MTGCNTSGASMHDDVIDIDEVLQALDRDLERRLSIAQRLEPILREVVAYYGVPADNWHSFGIAFWLEGKDTSRIGMEVAGMEVAGMALRASGAREQHEGAATTAHVPTLKRGISGGGGNI